MAFASYRQVLGLPGVRTLLLVGLIARIPLTGSGMALTLHVVNGLETGFFGAGMVGAIVLIGNALGAPIAGRCIDRYGLRPVMAVTAIVQLLFWSFAPVMSFPVLASTVFLAGLFAPPVFGAVRQCLAAMVPADRYRTAFALDSIGVDLAYMVGPAVAAAAATAVSTTATLYGTGVGLVGSGLVMYLLNPPTRSAEEQRAGDRPVPRREWLGAGLTTLLGAVAGLTFVLTATELAIIAMLRGSGATEWSGLVLAVWSAYSIMGGLIYGGMPRGLHPLLLIGALSAVTAPIGLVGGEWWWILLALIPSGLLCAPAISSSVDAVNRRVPAGARGEAMGLHGMALTIGGALAAPAAGAMIDGFGPAIAFALCGGIGLLCAFAALPFQRGGHGPRAGGDRVDVAAGEQMERPLSS